MPIFRSTRRGCTAGRSLYLGVSLCVAACSAELAASHDASTKRDPQTASGGMTSASDDHPDSGMVTRGAGMPIVPIRRADAGVHADASVPVGNPPMRVSPGDAGRDAAAVPPTQGSRDDAGAAPPVLSIDAGQVPAPDAGGTLPPGAALPLPEPIHRYAFAGGGTNVPDLAGGSDAIVRGNAQLDGQGSVSFPGQGDGFVELPGDLLQDVTSFTLLIWLSTGSDACWQRALDLTFSQQSSPSTLLTSLFLTPHGCPDGLPTLGYLTAGPEYHLLGETTIAPAEVVQLGASYSARSQTLRLIVNGVVQEEQSVPVDVLLLQRAHGMLGRSQLEDPQLQGSISELRVYASRLEPAELHEIYARGPDTL